MRHSVATNLAEKEPRRLALPLPVPAPVRRRRGRLLRLALLLSLALTTLLPACPAAAAGKEEHPLYLEAEHQLNIGRFAEGLSAAEAFLAVQPDSAWGWRASAIAYRGLGRTQELKDLFAARIARGEQLALAHFVLAYLAYQEEEPDVARAHLVKSLAAGYGKEPLALNLMGAIDSDRGELDSARRFIEQALTLAPDLELAHRNLLNVRSLAVRRDALSALGRIRAGGGGAVAAELQKVQSSGPDPLSGVEVLFARQAFNGKAVLAVVTEQAELGTDIAFFVDPQGPGSRPAAEMGDDSPADPDSEWSLDEQFARRVLFVRQSTFTGSHHTRMRLFYLDSEGHGGTLQHEWQISQPIALTDLDADGIPEAVFDYSDYYVLSFAEGVVDFNFYIYRLDPARGGYVFVPYQVEIPGLAPRAAALNAEALFYVGRGEWGPAREKMAAARAQAPGVPALVWNAIIVERHARAFADQYAEQPSAVTAALLGDPARAGRHAAWPPSFSSQPVVRFLAAALRTGTGTPPGLALARQIYGSGGTAGDLVESIEFLPDDQKQEGRRPLHPEIRALENAWLGYANDRIVYAPPGIRAKAMLRLLAGPPEPELRATLRAVPPPQPGLFIGYGTKSFSEFFADEQVDQAFSEGAKGFIAERLITLLRRKDFAAAEALLNRIESAWPDDPSMSYGLIYVRRTIDLRFGRYQAVVRSLADHPLAGDLPALEAYERLGLATVAHERYEEALDAYERSGGAAAAVRTLDAFIAHLGLGRLAYKDGDLDEARRQFLASLDLIPELGDLPYEQIAYPQLLTWLARVHLRRGDLELARAYNALAYHANMRRIEPGEGWIQSSFQADYEILPNVFFTDFLIAQAAGDRRLAFGYLSAAISIVKDLYLLTPESEDRFGIDEVAHEIFRAAVRFHLDLGRDAEAFALLDSVKQTTTLQELLRRRGMANAGLASLGERSLAELTAPLQAQSTAVLQYLVEEDELVILVLDAAGGLHAARVPAARRELRGWINEALDSALGLDAGSAAAGERRAQALAALHDRLIGPVASVLRPGDRLLVVPDRELFQLPFAILRSHDGRYLVEDHVISYAGSLSSQAALGTSDGAREESILLVHSPLTERLDPLAHSRREAEAVARLFPPEQVTLLSGAAATTAAFRAAARERTIIHVASHSAVDIEAPERSEILLGERRDQDGQPVREAVRLADLLDGRLPLERSPLVVLSSCASAQGRVYEEGLFGLVQGFFLSGAASVLVTQWEIADEPSPQVMTRFYTAYLDRHDIAGALRDAQVALLRQGAGMDVWGPFVVYGRDRR